MTTSGSWPAALHKALVSVQPVYPQLKPRKVSLHELCGWWTLQRERNFFVCEICQRGLDKSCRRRLHWTTTLPDWGTDGYAAGKHDLTPVHTHNYLDHIFAVPPAFSSLMLLRRAS